MERREFHQFQEQMKTAVLTGQKHAMLLGNLKETGGVPVEKRLNIHHNNFRETLSSSLAGVFPVLEAFVGSVFLKGALGEFCQQNPPEEAALSGYGSRFADFLEGHVASEQVPYAADIIRMEWAVHELQLIDELDLDQFKNGGGNWRLNPNVRIIASSFPILSLWSVANGHLPPEAVSFDQGGQTVAVILSGGEVSLLALDADESLVVERLSGQGFTASESEAAADIGSVAQALNEKQIIIPV